MGSPLQIFAPVIRCFFSAASVVQDLVLPHVEVAFFFAGSFMTGAGVP